MEKTIKRKISVLFVALCVVIIAFITLYAVEAQAQEAQNNNTNYESVGSVARFVEKCQPEFHDFKNIDELINYVDYEYKDANHIEVELYKDFDFQNHILKVYENQYVKFNLKNYTIFSGSLDSDNSTMFDVKGTLNLTSDSATSHGIVKEVSSDNSAFNVSGRIVADRIDFVKPEKLYRYSDKGGFLYFYDVNQNSEFNDCNFTGHAKEGGAVYINNFKEQKKEIKFNDCNFSECIAGEGGAIYNNAEYSNLVFNNCKFLKCHSGDGGAIASEDNNQIYTFNKTVFNNCRASDDGGAIYVYGSNVKFIGGNKDISQSDYTTFIDCKAYDDGGAIYTSAATGKGNKTSYEYFNFFSNEAETGYGGAIGNRGADTNVENSVFKQNKSDCVGGATYSACTNGICFDSCVFENNTSNDGDNVACMSTSDFRKCKNNTVFCHGTFDAVREFGQYYKEEDLKDHFRIIVIPND